MGANSLSLFPEARSQFPGVELPPGVWHAPGALSLAEQESVVADLRERLKEAPFFRPYMPERPGSPASGVPFSVRMTNLGPLGWVSERRGARYQPVHPKTQQPWPPIPDFLLGLWQRFTLPYWQEAGRGSAPLPPPDCCLVNWYSEDAHMGLHRDNGEAARELPIVSLSLGRSATFRIADPDDGRTQDPNGRIHKVRLNSGDIIAFGGASRLSLHGVPRLLKLRQPGNRGTGTDPLDLGGRLNLTLRRITPA
ncbi:alpha-ketoglutarate-dependent dioxygenase AlkB [Oecophyllibacter saccharovorans]|uniref:alpha-ketoglutarate-dependent dioxygenase AlkB n=1 Tax=Oecophyllibacter saccharovorans TaxID=2558360 RepID=UPI00116D970A|nr:alpha-ketoglutarate-dependent dioxygenase AlkB [Oecophyllibacter saccharovorans]TPW35135.1 alpha-ketoglutarate-dependent dioxygenase AlkB [Oecophyllibacter saccharovorans]